MLMKFRGIIQNFSQDNRNSALEEYIKHIKEEYEKKELSASSTEHESIINRILNKKNDINIVYDHQILSIYLTY